MTDKTDLTLLAVHAHPDDEAFSMGGTLARLAAENVRTVLVCATRGEVGEIHDPDLDPEEAKERLGAIREQELRRACEVLNISESTSSGLPRLRHDRYSRQRRPS